MRIAVLVRGIDGGAAISTAKIEEILSEDHETRLFGCDDEPVDGPSRTIKRLWSHSIPLPIEMERFARYPEFYIRFRKELAAFDPDLIITQHEMSFLAARMSRKLDIPMVLFVHDEQFTYEDTAGSYLPTRLANLLFMRINRRFASYIISSADAVFAVSDYMKQQYEDYWGIDVEVMYDPIDPDDYTVEETGDRILHVNPNRHKGIDVTLDVAEMLPDESFLVVGRAPRDRAVEERMEELDNVEWRGYVDDMRDVYRETGIVLIPSRWNEPFARIHVEAELNGIPVICSGSGGLKELVSERFIIESYDPDDYVAKIRDIQENYEDYSEHAREDAAGKTADAQMETFRAVLAEHGIEL